MGLRYPIAFCRISFSKLIPLWGRTSRFIFVKDAMTLTSKLIVQWISKCNYRWYQYVDSCPMHILHIEYIRIQIVVKMQYSRILHLDKKLYFGASFRLNLLEPSWAFLKLIEPSGPFLKPSWPFFFQGRVQKIDALPEVVRSQPMLVSLGRDTFCTRLMVF